MHQDLEAIAQVRELVAQAAQAAQRLQHYSQEETDRLVAVMAVAGYRARQELAELAVVESGFGRVASKVEKNAFATRTLYQYIKSLRTVGIIEQDEQRRVFSIAAPMGVVAGIIPITNPTSTALFKILIAIKARCPIVLSPHPRGLRCISRTAAIMSQAADAIGAPAGLIGCLTIPTLEATQALMTHPQTAVILATGGSGLVKAAYSSGKPAIGVGPGNCPAFIEESADIPHAVRCLVLSQGFDWGTICSSEQALVVQESIASAVLEECRRQKAYICKPEEVRALEALMPDGKINPRMVGQSPAVLAQMANFKVPADTTFLLVAQGGVGPAYPLSGEKLCPILAFYQAADWHAGCERCLELIHYGGMGHTMVIHSRNREVIQAFALQKPVARLLINAPSSQGAVGYATGLAPSMTLGCGVNGGNITTDNITPLHLINVKRLAYDRGGWQNELPTPPLDLPPSPPPPSKAPDPFADYPDPQRKYYIGPHNRLV